MVLLDFVLEGYALDLDKALEGRAVQKLVDQLKAGDTVKSEYFVQLLHIEKPVCKLRDESLILGLIDVLELGFILAVFFNQKGVIFFK